MGPSFLHQISKQILWTRWMFIYFWFSGHEWFVPIDLLSLSTKQIENLETWWIDKISHKIVSNKITHRQLRILSCVFLLFSLLLIFVLLEKRLTFFVFVKDNVDLMEREERAAGKADIRVNSDATPLSLMYLSLFRGMT